jgi:hypothetical protein
MSEDRREAVLSRLFDLITAIGDFNAAERNLDELPEGVRPCAVLIDGDENRSADSEGRNGQPIIMVMTPIIAIGVSGQVDDIGPNLSSLRSQVISKTLNDATLRSIIGPNGKVIYDGLTGKLSHGSLMAADAEIRFAISYPLKPAAL